MDPNELERVGSFNGQPDRKAEMVEYARARAASGEPMSPATAQATQRWSNMSAAQRVLQLHMLESVDPAAAAEARGYAEAGFFGDVPRGADPHAAPDIDQLAADSGQTQQVSTTRPQKGRVNPPEDQGLLARAKQVVSQYELDPVAAAAAATGIPYVGPAIAGAVAGEGLRRGMLADNAEATNADEKSRQGGQKPVPTPGPQTLQADLIVPTGGGGGGAQIIEPGVATLHSSSRQTQQVREPGEAAFLRETGAALELDSITKQYNADRQAAHEMIGFAQDRERINERFRIMEEERARRAAEIKADGERRIAEAEKAFEDAAPDPKWNPYQEVANGSWDKKVMLGLGSMLGALGASMTKGPNYFLETFNAQIQRRIELARQHREHLGKTVTGRKDAYSRALAALGSQRAMDAIEEARMWRALDIRIEQVAAQQGYDSLDARVQALRAGAVAKHREKMMEAAQHVTEVSAAQQAFKPVVVVGGGGGGKDPLAEGLEKMLDHRIKLGLPELEGTLNNMNAAILGFAANPSMRDQLATWLSTGKVGDAMRIAVPYFVGNPAALSTFLNSYSEYRKSIGGAALTDSEIAAMQAQVGKGDIAGLSALYESLVTSKTQKERELHAAYPQVFQIFHHNRTVGGNTPGPQSQFVPTRPAVGGAGTK